MLCVMGSFEGATFLTRHLLRACCRPMAAGVGTWAFGILNAAMVAGCGVVLREASITGQVSGVALCKLIPFVLAYVPVNMALAKQVSGASIGEFAKALSSGTVAAVAVFIATSTLKRSLALTALGATPALLVTLTFAFLVGLG